MIKVYAQTNLIAEENRENRDGVITPFHSIGRAVEAMYQNLDANEFQAR